MDEYEDNYYRITLCTLLVKAIGKCTKKKKAIFVHWYRQAGRVGTGGRY